MQELDRFRTIESTEGTTLLLTLAPPRNSNITGILKRNRYERKQHANTPQKPHNHSL